MIVFEIDGKRGTYDYGKGLWNFTGDKQDRLRMMYLGGLARRECRGPAYPDLELAVYNQVMREGFSDRKVQIMQVIPKRPPAKETPDDPHRIY